MISDKTPSPCPLTQTQYFEFSVHCAVRNHVLLCCQDELCHSANNECCEFCLRSMEKAGWESCQVLPDARRSTYRPAVTARKKRTTWAGGRGDKIPCCNFECYSKHSNSHWRAGPLGRWLPWQYDTPNTSGLCGFVSWAWVEGEGRSWGLSRTYLDASFLAYFIL